VVRSVSAFGGYAARWRASSSAVVEASTKIVEEYLRSAYQPGMSAQDLFSNYVSFGEDPFIIATPSKETEVLFSARDYAKRRCDELCVPVQGRNDDS